MSKHLNATQNKIAESIERSEKLAEDGANGFTFDYPCINDYCPSKNGTRAIGIAWKAKNTVGTFCYECGCENILTKEEFKVNDDKIKKEKLFSNIEKENKKLEESKLKSQFVDNYKFDYDFEADEEEF